MKKSCFTCEVENIFSADVIVAGGGTAGAIAAIAAAREGVKVALIEQFGALGGSSTMGLVTPMMHIYIEGNPENSYIGDELNKQAEKDGYFIFTNGREGFFDTVYMKYLLEKKIVEEKNIRLFFHTSVIGVEKTGEKITALIIHDKAGIHRIEGKIFIDCTGDGDLAVLAGVPYSSGNPESGLNQCLSLRYIVSGIDLDAFYECVPDSVQRYKRDNYYYAFCTRLDGERSLDKLMTHAMNAGELLPEDLRYWQCFSVPGRLDTLAFNTPEFFDFRDGTNPEHLTRAQLEGKQRAYRHLKFYKKHLKGFEKAYIAEIAPMVGVRESREIQCHKTLTFTEARNYTKFSDAIAQTNYPIDVHGVEKERSNNFAGDLSKEKPYFEIPYRCLVANTIDNLLIGGRCIGVDFYVQASIRIQPTCRATGEAAGIAAAMCVQQKVLPIEIKGENVRKHMQEQGASFHV